MSTQKANPDPFIEGHLRDRYERGERPDFREPRNPLPKVRPGASMEVVPSFIAGRKKK